MTRREEDLPAKTKQGTNRKEDEDGNEDEFADAMEERFFLYAFAVAVLVGRAGDPIRHLSTNIHWPKGR